MKKLITLTLLFLFSFTVFAQRSDEYLHGGKKQKVELSAGDYLVKSSQNMWMSGLFAVLSSACLIVEARYSNSSGEFMNIPAVVFGGISIYHSICIPINTRRAGKALNRDKTQ